MQKLAMSLTFAACSISLVAQHTIQMKINKLPVHHPSGSSIFVAGSFNGWNPGDESYKFKRDGNGTYSIDLKLQPGNYEYKITRGSWENVECMKDGSGIQNRVINVTGASAIALDIEEWQDRFPKQPRKSTATKNVQILDTAFWIPQLKRTRRIWLHLPENYANSSQRYDVLYMHDGQNIFDDATSFSGEWGVDELVESSGKQVIVIGIDHGGNKRLNEYNPYDNERFGKGEGDAYVDFIVKTLKPYIDKHYRTNKDRNSTMIAGSSMGGLISMYAVLKYPKVFGGVGVFSPAFWVAPQIYDAIRKKGKKVKANVYFYAGKQEGERMVPDMLKAFEEMNKVSKSKMKSVIRDDGRHNEAAWRKEFLDGFYYMLSGEVYHGSKLN